MDGSSHGRPDRRVEQCTYRDDEDDATEHAAKEEEGNHDPVPLLVTRVFPCPLRLDGTVDDGPEHQCQARSCQDSRRKPSDRQPAHRFRVRDPVSRCRHDERAATTQASGNVPWRTTYSKERRAAVMDSTRSALVPSPAPRPRPPRWCRNLVSQPTSGATHLPRF